MVQGEWSETEGLVLHQRTKDLCFLLISKGSFPNYLFRRYLRPLHNGNGHGVHLHLGCGHAYLQGFINIDANPFLKTDLWLDARNGLPFSSTTVDSIYATHVLEHFYPDELQSLLREFARVLKEGGGVRLVVPSLSSAIAAYAQGRKDWFTSYFPRRYESIGGRFSNFVFCDGQHRLAFDFSYFEEVLTACGFSRVLEMSEGHSQLYGDNVAPYQPGDDPELPHSLYVEAFR
jgi:predicted SAM-dependent methyltransferase